MAAVLEVDKNGKALLTAGMTELTPGAVAAVTQQEELLALLGLVPASLPQLSVAMSKDALFPELTVACLPIATNLSFVLGFSWFGLAKSLAIFWG